MNKEFLFSTLPLVFALAAIISITKIMPGKDDRDGYGIGAVCAFSCASVITAILAAFNL